MGNHQTIFNAVIGAMFVVILGMTGYIVGVMNGDIAENAKRLDRFGDRLNDFDRRMAVIEDRVMDIREKEGLK